MSSLIQAAELPPAQPKYILRGHKAQIHALHFLRNNTRLLSGDATGHVILWDTSSKRARVVWKAHDGGILGFGVWGSDKIISHGRDGRIKVWQLRVQDEEGLERTLPVDIDGEGDGDEEGGKWRDPWMLHSLRVYTLNFCQFALCEDEKAENPKGVLVATPAANEGATAIHTLPSEELVYLVPPAAKTPKTGMVMALRIAFIGGILHVVTGYESGISSVQRLKSGIWETITISKSHSQPILSLDMSASSGSYLTSGADAAIAMASLTESTDATPVQVFQTKHSGQQSLSIRSDGKIFATAGWDGRIRVYAVKTMMELAVLKWHKEGCYSLAIAQIPGGDDTKAPGIPDSTEGEVGKENKLTLPNTTKSVLTVRQRREEKAKDSHWLAAGSKDGKVSLWDIY